jgi:hypothetical protein
VVKVSVFFVLGCDRGSGDRTHAGADYRAILAARFSANRAA